MSGRRIFVAPFAAIAVVHLALNAADATPWDSITKCLLAPVLIAWVVASGGPRLLALALVFCLAGDLLLEIDGLFVPGMAAFALAHGCFIGLFVQRGALTGLRRRPWIGAVYLVAGVAVIGWAWGGLEPDLRPIVPFYALLLVGTAATSAAVSRMAGLGGAFFLVSDGVIALSEAGRFDPDAVGTGLAIMSLYSAAIALLTFSLDSDTCAT